jgi:glycosyltransferase involved in cell wall biosynthesis
MRDTYKDNRATFRSHADSDTTAPEVSVVIPAYNSAQYLGEAVQSIFDQTFDNYEIIVVDDGSTDNTRELVESYGGRIRYVRQENGGASKARNRGIAEARGTYIAFLDADDCWEPEKLEKQINILESNPNLGMVFTDAVGFDENGPLPRMGRKKSLLLDGDVACNIFMYSGVGTPSVMVPKKVFDKVGVFDEQLFLAEDDNMWIRIAAEYPVELIDEPLVKVRDHANRTTRDKGRLFRMILDNADALASKYGKASDRIMQVLPRKLAQVQFGLGRYCLEENRYAEARQAFADGIACDKRFLKNYFYWALCLLPRWAVESIRRLKAGVRKVSSPQ